MSATASFRALGTTAVVAVTDDAALPRARAAAEREIAAIDAACSRFREDSDLMRVNACAGSTVRVRPLLLDALRTALRAAAATGGLVDPTIGRTLRTLGYDRTFTLVRSRDGRSFRAHSSSVVGWRAVELDEDAATVRIPAGTELDLGATAKALAADRAARGAAEAAGCGTLVGLGGDVAVAGAPPEPGWPVRVADDHAADADAPGQTVALASGGIATSGTSVRTWRAGAAALHHIVDPRTGLPARTPWRTVSVAAESCVDANIASTAAIVLGDAAPQWLAARSLPSRLVTTGGVAESVAGWPQEAA